MTIRFYWINSWVPGPSYKVLLHRLSWITARFKGVRKGTEKPAHCHRASLCTQDTGTPETSLLTLTFDFLPPLKPPGTQTLPLHLPSLDWPSKSWSYSTVLWSFLQPLQGHCEFSLWSPRATESHQIHPGDRTLLSLICDSGGIALELQSQVPNSLWPLSNDVVGFSFTHQISTEHPSCDNEL